MKYHDFFEKFKKTMSNKNFWTMLIQLNSNCVYKSWRAYESLYMELMKQLLLSGAQSKNKH